MTSVDPIEVDGTCPECGSHYDTLHGLKMHHSRAHGEVLYSNEDICEQLRVIAKRLGRAPTGEEAAELTPNSRTTYTRRFGAFRNAITEAGLEPQTRHGISDDELLADVSDLADKLGRPPTRGDADEHLPQSTVIYYRRWGKWSNVLSEVGIDHQSQVTKELLIEELQSIQKEIGRTPYVRDIQEADDCHSTSPYVRLFGSWNAALKEAGFEPNEVRPRDKYYVSCEMCGGDLTRTGSEYFGRDYFFCDKECQDEWQRGGNHPKWEGGKFPYGEGWDESKREQARERDGRQCQNCGRDEEEHIAMFGRKHSVHHIQKARDFDDPEDRNGLDNLVTLCQTKECHIRWEKMSPLRPQVM